MAGSSLFSDEYPYASIGIVDIVLDVFAQLDDEDRQVYKTNLALDSHDDLLRLQETLVGCVEKEPREMQHVFLAGSAPVAQPSGEWAENTHTGYGEGAIGALAAIVAAAEALRRKKCDLAFVIALEQGTENKGSALLLKRADDSLFQSYALLRSGLVDNNAENEYEMFLETCERAQVAQNALTLIDLLGMTAIQAGRVLTELTPTMSRGLGALPHCAITAGGVNISACEAVRRVCQLVMSIQAHRLPSCAELVSAIPLANPFCGHRTLRSWIANSPRQAAVLAVDGGKSACLLIEEVPAKHAVASRSNDLWPYEVLLVGAHSKIALLDHLRYAVKRIIEHGLSWVLQDGFLSEGKCENDWRYRSAIVVRDEDDAVTKMNRLIAQLTVDDGAAQFQTVDGIFYAGGRTSSAPYKTAFVFPGQSSHYLGMFGDLCLYMPGMQAWFETLHATLDKNERCPGSCLISPPEYGLTEKERRTQQKRLWNLSGGGFTSVVGSLALYDIVTSAGVKPEAIVGYSNGENSALIASGTWKFSSIEQMCSTFAKVRQSALFESPLMDVTRGRTVAVNNAPRASLAEVLQEFKEDVFLSLDNCTGQVVLFGDDRQLTEAIKKLEQSGAVCLHLPFRRGHHTPAFSRELEQLKPLYSQFRYGHSRVPIYSCVTVAPFPDDPAEIQELVERQWIKPVRFRETIERLYAEGVRCFVEVGPAKNLTSFIHNTLRGREYVAIASNSKTKHGLEQLLHALGHLFVLGHSIDIEALKQRALKLRLFESQLLEVEDYEVAMSGWQ